MWFALSVIAGFSVGGVIAWLLAKERTRKETRNLVTALRTPHIGGIGKSLEKANEAYNSAVGSLEARVSPAARKFKLLTSMKKVQDNRERRNQEKDSGSSWQDP